MFNAFDADPEVAPSSPGDLLLGRIVAQACREGATRFDLGIGAARYKAALCDEEIALFDTFVPITPQGHIAAAAIAARQVAKRIVKGDPRLFALAGGCVGAGSILLQPDHAKQAEVRKPFLR